MLRPCLKCAGSGVFTYQVRGTTEGCFACGGTRTMRGCGKVSEERRAAQEAERVRQSAIARAAKELTPYIAPTEPEDELPTNTEQQA